MAKKVQKKAKILVKKKQNVEKKRVPLWKWVIILIPLIVAIMWAISILIVYNEIPIVYEQASPQGVKTLLALIFIFIITYSAYIYMKFVVEPAKA